MGVPRDDPRAVNCVSPTDDLFIVVMSINGLRSARSRTVSPRTSLEAWTYESSSSRISRDLRRLSTALSWLHRQPLGQTELNEVLLLDGLLTRTVPKAAAATVPTGSQKLLAGRTSSGEHEKNCSGRSGVFHVEHPCGVELQGRRRRARSGWVRSLSKRMSRPRRSKRVRIGISDA